jgi:amino acid permease
LRKIEALGFTSLLSLLPLGFLLILQIVFLGTLGVGGEVPLFKSSFFLALPIFVFAFSSQQAFFPIYNGKATHYYTPIVFIITILLLTRDCAQS